MCAQMLIVVLRWWPVQSSVHHSLWWQKKRKKRKGQKLSPIDINLNMLQWPHVSTFQINELRRHRSKYPAELERKAISFVTTEIHALSLRKSRVRLRARYIAHMWLTRWKEVNGSKWKEAELNIVGACGEREREALYLWERLPRCTRGSKDKFCIGGRSLVDLGAVRRGSWFRFSCWSTGLSYLGRSLFPLLNLGSMAFAALFPGRGWSRAPAIASNPIFFQFLSINLLHSTSWFLPSNHSQTTTKRRGMSGNIQLILTPSCRIILKNKHI